MNKLFGYSIGLLVALMAVSFIAISFMMASAHEVNETTIYNNTLNNISLNLSTINNTVPGKSNVEMIDPVMKVIAISSDKMADPANSIRFGICNNVPRVTAFIISGYTRPTKGAIYENQSLLNAACLSRIVEGTPHGYATYYN